MDISCIYCNASKDTRKETVYVTVEWIYKRLLEMNNLEPKGAVPRVVKICSNCWDNVFKKKVEDTNYYWTFNKEI